MNIEIVHNQVDGLCIGISIYDGFYYMSKLRGASVGSGRSEVATCLRFYNPKHISGFDDLKRTDITFVNRQKGSGTRVLLDNVLGQHNIRSEQIKGYSNELDTHLAVAGEIARGKADVGLGIQAAATTCNLGFLNLIRERYDLVIPIENYNNELLKPLLEILRSQEFKKIISNVGGYDISETGTTTFSN